MKSEGCEIILENRNHFMNDEGLSQTMSTCSRADEGGNATYRSEERLVCSAPRQFEIHEPIPQSTEGSALSARRRRTCGL